MCKCKASTCTVNAIHSLYCVQTYNGQLDLKADQCVKSRHSTSPSGFFDNMKAEHSAKPFDN